MTFFNWVKEMGIYVFNIIMNVDIMSRIPTIKTLREAKSEVDLMVKYKNRWINIEVNSGIITRNFNYICNRYGKNYIKGQKNLNEIEEAFQYNFSRVIYNKVKLIEKYQVQNEYDR